MVAVLISAFLLSFSSCLDNIVVGIAYGMKKTKIGFISNLLIAVITSCGTLVSMLFGRFIASIISVSIAQALGSAMIILIGIYFVLEYFIKKKRGSVEESQELMLELDESCDVDYDYDNCYNNCGDCSNYSNEKKLSCSSKYTKKISIKETILLAFALTINNLGIGISASLAGVSIVATVLFTFVISILTIMLGLAMGSNLIGRLFGKFASLVSGILMLILGIFELF